MTGGAPLREFQALARRAADAGFSGLVVTEAGRTAYLACAAAALTGADLDLATGVAVAFPRSPMVTAANAWELADVSGGRFRLGHRSPGEGACRAALLVRVRPSRAPPARARARPSGDLPRVPRRRALGLRRRLHQALAAAGHVVAGPDRGARPARRRRGGEPVDAAHGRRGRRRCARPPAQHDRPTPARRCFPTWPRAPRRGGREGTRLALFVPLFTAVGDTDEERSKWRETSRTMVAFYGSTPNYAFIFEQLGFRARPNACGRRRSGATWRGCPR